jgi:hypothetical protein
MRILAFLVVWEKKVGRSFALCHRVRHTLVPKYTPRITNQILVYVCCLMTQVGVTNINFTQVDASSVMAPYIPNDESL